MTPHATPFAAVVPFQDTGLRAFEFVFRGSRVQSAFVLLFSHPPWEGPKKKKQLTP